MKFTINTVPSSAIASKLYDWFAINPHICPRYIVMSQKTEKYIVDTEEHFYVTGERYIPYFHGIPIALCNNLKFGEIEFV